MPSHLITPQHRTAVGVADQPLGHATDEQPLESTESSGAADDVGVLGVGAIEFGLRELDDRSSHDPGRARDTDRRVLKP